jgi:hypothetical protein
MDQDGVLRLIGDPGTRPHARFPNLSTLSDSDRGLSGGEERRVRWAGTDEDIMKQEQQTARTWLRRERRLYDLG